MKKHIDRAKVELGKGGPDLSSTTGDSNWMEGGTHQKWLGVTFAFLQNHCKRWMLKGLLWLRFTRVAKMGGSSFAWLDPPNMTGFSFRLPFKTTLSSPYVGALEPTTPGSEPYLASS